jgi:hypothetical protein
MRPIGFILSSFSFFLFLVFLGTSFPPVWPDEVLFFEPARDLLDSGSLRTSVLSGLVPGMDSKTLWMPPFYFWIQSGWQFILGDSLESIRSLSGFLIIFSLGISLLFFHRIGIFNLKSKLFISIWISIFSIFVYSDLLVIRIANTARMESLCLCLGIGSIYLSYLGKYSYSGFLQGLSVLTHPFGIFYGFVNLWNLTKDKNQGKNLLYFVSAGVLSLLVWFYYISPDWELFLHQFGSQLSRKKSLLSEFGIIDKLRVLVGFYYFSYLQILSFCLLIVLLFLAYKRSRDQKLTRFISIWFLSMGLGYYLSSEAWYVIHLIWPLFLIFLLYGINLLRSKKEYLILSLIFAISLFQFLYFLSGAFYREDVHAKTESFFRLISEESREANSMYIHSIPDPYFYLRKEHLPIEEETNKKIYYEFIPGRLVDRVDSSTQDTLDRIDLFVFSKEMEIPEFLKIRLENQNLYLKKTREIPYTSRVPFRGPWGFIAYHKIKKEK